MEKCRSMNTQKKVAIRTLVRHILDGEMHDTLYEIAHVRRPYVVVILKERGRTGVGVAKACYPDKWDEEKGKRIAKARAARELAEHIFDTTAV